MNMEKKDRVLLPLRDTSNYDHFTPPRRRTESINDLSSSLVNLKSTENLALKGQSNLGSSSNLSRKPISTFFDEKPKSTTAGKEIDMLLENTHKILEGSNSNLSFYKAKKEMYGSSQVLAKKTALQEISKIKERKSTHDLTRKSSSNDISKSIEYSKKELNPKQKLPQVSRTNKTASPLKKESGKTNSTGNLLNSSLSKNTLSNTSLSKQSTDSLQNVGSVVSSKHSDDYSSSEEEMQDSE
ncbi:hypothetical protein HDV06_001972 [Boothiomyces sp. JEL0866]|nr:hypothetical protein HDV06_001972 [Boothiomyces sp. JEL0866]